MSVLGTLALKSGFPILRSILEGRLGGRNGGLAADVIDALAKRAGVAPTALERLVEESPDKVVEAMREVEPMAPELIAFYQKGLAHQSALLMAEQQAGGWKAAWRPLLMYFTMFLWAWQAVVLHVANAIWKIALPPMPWDQLLGFTGISMGLYMGGHTIKDVFSKVMERRT